jgi:lysophospholipase L1-like esterase
MAERWQPDTLDLKPDLLSILIGINDTAAWVNGNKTFTAEEYEQGYRTLLQRTRDQLSNIQLVLCEPFILPVGKVKDMWDKYKPEVQKRQVIVKRLSEEFNAIHVPFQKAFDAALSKAPADYWIWDGIHPMPAGHELMAREWMARVSKKLKFIGDARHD